VPINRGMDKEMEYKSDMKKEIMPAVFSKRGWK
jgi:hypothetical protein